jgi:hypothetical protein
MLGIRGAGLDDHLAILIEFAVVVMDARKRFDNAAVF